MWNDWFNLPLAPAPPAEKTRQACPWNTLKNETKKNPAQTSNLIRLHRRTARPCNSLFMAEIIPPANNNRDNNNTPTAINNQNKSNGSNNH